MAPIIEARLPRRRSLALVFLPVAAVLAWPGGAGAGHRDCGEWGAMTWIDLAEKEPVAIETAGPRWGCTGPVTRTHVRVGDHILRVDSVRTEVRAEWETDEADRSERPRPSPPHARAVPRVRLSVTPLRATVGRRVRFRFRTTFVRSGGEPAPGTTIRFAGRRLRTDGAGRASVVLSPRRAGKRKAVAYRSGRRVAVRTVTISKGTARR